jgi:hypothetical protein
MLNPTLTHTPATRALLPALLGLAACGGEGTWEAEIWGEDYIEAGIPAEVFADGCAATFDRFDLRVAAAQIEGGEAGPLAVDLTAPGPQPLASVEVPAGLYDEVQFTMAPGDAEGGVGAGLADLGASLVVEGALSCPGGAVDFAWAFDTAVTWACAPDGLNIGKGGAGRSQLTVHGDHLFYNGLEDPEALVVGEAMVAADSDGDGDLTQVELQAAALAPLGYTVGSHGEVSDLWAFLEVQTRSLGHIDGEGHCAVK